MRWETMWEFRTANFRILAQIAPEKMDPADSFSDPEDIEGVRSGKYDWFCSRVVVLGPDGAEMGSDYLGGSAYLNAADFFSDHRTAERENRNTLANKARGVRFCTYFPGMVAEAVSQARKAFPSRVAAMQAVKLRAASPSVA